MSEKFFGRLQTLRQKMRDDINLAKDPYEILLSVAKEVGAVTGEENFYTEIREDMMSIYGNVFQAEKILEIELAEVTARRKKIKAAFDSGNFTGDDQARIEKALSCHDAEIARLTSLSAKQKNS